MTLSFIKAFFLALVGLPIMLLGFLLVAVGLPFRKSYPETIKPFTQFPSAATGCSSTCRPGSNHGESVRWLSRRQTGLVGQRPREESTGGFWSMWLWMAIRNPANYWNRVITGVDASAARSNGSTETPTSSSMLSLASAIGIYQGDAR